MSGAEMIPLASSMVAKAGEIVEGAQKESRAVASSLRSEAENSPAWRAASDAYARRQLVKQELLLRLFQPLAKIAGLSQEYFTGGQFSHDLAEKLEGVPESELTAPKASVAGPTLESMRYVLDEDALKDLFLNLLATASLQSGSKDAHPSFVEVIKQLSGTEAQLLKIFIKLDVQPIVRIVAREKPSQRYIVLHNHVLGLIAGDIQIAEPALGAFVDNWIRLGILDVGYTDTLSEEKLYDWADLRPELALAKSAFETPPAADGNVWEVEYDKGIARLTDFGKQFRSAVVDLAAVQDARRSEDRTAASAASEDTDRSESGEAAP